jgi:acetoin utilization deacetylase AcuC-like enzyme
MLLVAHHPCYAHPLPPGHRFPMEKYDLIPQQLLYEGTLLPEQLVAPEPLDPAIAAQTHTPDYVHRLLTQQIGRAEERRMGFPMSPALVHRELVIAQGTIVGAEHALRHGCAFNVAGGTHHAYTDRGEGFCLLNDQAIAANWLLNTGRAERILMVDLDVHQGQGTAQIFQREPRVFTFSMHGRDNYPLHKEESDLDLALPTGTGDTEYLQLLRATLPGLFEQHRPDFVFYLSGADPLHTDKLGLLALTPNGLRQRDQFVLAECHHRGLPVQVSMGGGYSPRVADIVHAHCNTFRVAAGLWG